jgi:type IV pilus assembly protein PilA
MVDHACSSNRRGRSNSSGQRGFSLVELMIAVAIVGVLCVIGLGAYTKFVDSTKVSEPVYVMNGIRAAEEQYRQEGVSPGYLDVSGPGGTYYPQNLSNNGSFGPTRYSFDYPGGPNYAGWRTLNVTVDSPVRYGYTVNAGLAGTPIATRIDMTKPPAGFPPAQPADHWYVLQAQGNPSGNGPNTKLLAMSLTSELFWENQ